MKTIGIILAAALVSLAPSAASAQQTGIPAQTRVRLNLHTSERSLMGRPMSQTLTGALIETRADTFLIQVRPGIEPLRVPHSAIATLQITRGRPNRFESALRRALPLMIASAAGSALVSSLDDDAERSPSEAAWMAARRTLLVSGTVGFFFPKERWRKASLPPATAPIANK